jgi:hypothetical protein
MHAEIFILLNKGEGIVTGKVAIWPSIPVVLVEVFFRRTLL